MFENYDVPVRCDRGHLYTTIWIPFVSLKAVRLGSARFQHCPVGGHWAATRRVNPGELTADEAANTAALHDIRIP